MRPLGTAMTPRRVWLLRACPSNCSIDNNVSEREMKRIALLRKNALFAGNARGGRTAAVLSSLTSTCRRHGVDPQLYLTQLLANLPAWPVGDIDHWLPDVWKTRQPAGEEGQAAV